MNKFFIGIVFVFTILFSLHSYIIWANDFLEKDHAGETPQPDPTNKNRNCITLFSGPVYMTSKGVFHPGILLEYERIVRIRNLEMGLHFGSELLLTNDMPDDLHAGFSLGIGFDILNFFEVAIGPALIYHDQHFDPGWFISVGKMTDVGIYTLGPVFEYTKHEDDAHLFWGIGIGVRF